MDLMRLDRDGDVFVLHLTDENRFNPDSDAEWHEALDEVEASTGPAALVRTGTGKFYSNGLDLDRLAQDGGAPLGAYIPVMLRLFAIIRGTQTDGSGAYTLTDLTAGDWRLIVCGRPLRASGGRAAGPWT